MKNVATKESMIETILYDYRKATEESWDEGFIDYTLEELNDEVSNFKKSLINNNDLIVELYNIIKFNIYK